MEDSGASLRWKTIMNWDKLIPFFFALLATGVIIAVICALLIGLGALLGGWKTGLLVFGVLLVAICGWWRWTR